MTSTSKAYIPCLLATIIKCRHVIAWGRCQRHGESFVVWVRRSKFHYLLINVEIILETLFWNGLFPFQESLFCVAVAYGVFYYWIMRYNVMKYVLRKTKFKDPGCCCLILVFNLTFADYEWLDRKVFDSSKKLKKQLLWSNKTVRKKNWFQVQIFFVMLCAVWYHLCNFLKKWKIPIEECYF